MLERLSFIIKIYFLETILQKVAFCFVLGLSLSSMSSGANVKGCLSKTLPIDAALELRERDAIKDFFQMNGIQITRSATRAFIELAHLLVQSGVASNQLPEVLKKRFREAGRNDSLFVLENDGENLRDSKIGPRRRLIKTMKAFIDLVRQNYHSNFQPTDRLELDSCTDLTKCLQILNLSISQTHYLASEDSSGQVEPVISDKGQLIRWSEESVKGILDLKKPWSADESFSVDEIEHLMARQPLLASVPIKGQGGYTEILILFIQPPNKSFKTYGLVFSFSNPIKRSMISIGEVRSDSDMRNIFAGTTISKVQSLDLYAEGESNSVESERKYWKRLSEYNADLFDPNYWLTFQNRNLLLDEHEGLFLTDLRISLPVVLKLLQKHLIDLDALSNLLTNANSIKVRKRSNEQLYEVRLRKLEEDQTSVYDSYIFVISLKPDGYFRLVTAYSER